MTTSTRAYNATLVVVCHKPRGGKRMSGGLAQGKEGNNKKRGGVNLYKYEEQLRRLCLRRQPLDRYLLSRHGGLDEGGHRLAPSLTDCWRVMLVGPEEVSHNVLGAPQTTTLAVPPVGPCDLLASAPSWLWPRASPHPLVWRDPSVTEGAPATSGRSSNSFRCRSPVLPRKPES